MKHLTIPVSEATVERLLVDWPGWKTNAWHMHSSAGEIRNWFGSLVGGMRDASGQIYQRNRYYDPAAGQFTQVDPIGLAGGLNLYGFAAGDPVSFSDPFGLCPERYLLENGRCPGNLTVARYRVLAGATVSHNTPSVSKEFLQMLKSGDVLVSPLQSGAVAEMWTTAGRPQIVWNGNEERWSLDHAHPGDVAFDIAHEIAHVRQALTLGDYEDQLRDPAAREALERQADRFACENTSGTYFRIAYC